MATTSCSLVIRAPVTAASRSSLAPRELLGQPALVTFPSASAASPAAPRRALSARCSASAKDDERASHEHTARRVVNRRLVLGSMAAGMAAVVGCPICDSNEGAASIGAALAADWQYGDLSGPTEWGDLCKTGEAQSPVDIALVPAKLTKDNSLGSISFSYGLADASYLNTGHGTMQVNFPPGNNRIQIAGRQLDLLQYHFHAPSEHSFNGIRTAMEAHLVHRDADGKLAVVGILLEADPKAPRNVPLEAGLAFAPFGKGDQTGSPQECFEVPVVGDGSGRSSLKQCVRIQMSPQALLPKGDRPDGSHSYIHYQGSLTTPPCSEGVDWFVLATPLKVRDGQVLEFMRFVGDRQTLAFNSRPRQDLGTRRLVLGPA